MTNEQLLMQRFIIVVWLMLSCLPCFLKPPSVLPSVSVAAKPRRWRQAAAQLTARPVTRMAGNTPSQVLSSPSLHNLSLGSANFNTDLI